MTSTFQLADPASFPELLSERVRYSDTDMQGHVNNVAYLAYAETGRAELLFNGAIGRALAATPHATFVLARIEIDFLGETHWPAQVHTGTRVERLGRTSVSLGQGVFSSGAAKATARSTMVLIDRATRKPTPIEGGLRDAILSVAPQPEATDAPTAAPAPRRMEPMEPMKPMQPMTPMEGMKPMKPMEPVQAWWPRDLGRPSSSGAQNGMRYAFFPDTSRLAIDAEGTMTLYDTGSHRIDGVSQQDGGGTRNLAFSSQKGAVRLDELKQVD